LFERTRYNLGYPGLLLCDLIAAAVILDPEVVTEDLDVFAAVETSGVYGRGLTAIDYAGVTGNEPNVRLILQVDRERLGALLRRALIV
jgi:inosine-uridine nucleoside N-ribohydrolase